MTVTMQHEHVRVYLPRPWRCLGCGRVLGIDHGQRVVIQHAKRIITAPLPCSQVCDHCQTINNLDKSTHRG